MNNNTIAFTGLCKEYCGLLEENGMMTAPEFVEKMLRLLPRIYICAVDLSVKDATLEEEPDTWLEQSLTEENYEAVRHSLAALLGENDVYLEVFEEDMKYSDTPVAASISENLADIYQVAYDFTTTVRYGTDEVADMAVLAVKASFKEYWSMTLCNVLRALNHIWSKGLAVTDED